MYTTLCTRLCTTTEKFAFYSAQHIKHALIGPLQVYIDLQLKFTYMVLLPVELSIGEIYRYKLVEQILKVEQKVGCIIPAMP